MFVFVRGRKGRIVERGLFLVVRVLVAVGATSAITTAITTASATIVVVVVVVVVVAPPSIADRRVIVGAVPTLHITVAL